MVVQTRHCFFLLLVSWRKSLSFSHSQHVIADLWAPRMKSDTETHKWNDLQLVSADVFSSGNRTAGVTHRLKFYPVDAVSVTMSEH